MPPSVQSVLLRLDESPSAELYRVALGYGVVPAWYQVTGGRSPDAFIVPFFIGVLMMLRLAPMVVRKVLPFSADIVGKWAHRRRLAKRFDTYQWQKLLWIGLGLIAFQLRSGWISPALSGLTGACLVSGAIGLMGWRYHRASLVG